MAERFLNRLTESIGCLLLVVLSLVLLDSSAFAQVSIRSAREHYERAQYDEARATFEALYESRPKDHRLAFNAGAAAYRQGDFESATRLFEASLLSSDLALQQKGFYNRGNSKVRLGEKAEDPALRQSLWQSAIEDYQAAIGLDASDDAARTNLRRVQELLEQDPPQDQEQEQEQEQENQGEGDEDQEQDNGEGDDQDQEKGQNQDQGEDGDSSSGDDSNDGSESGKGQDGEGSESSQSEQGSGENGESSQDKGMEDGGQRNQPSDGKESEGPRGLNPQQEPGDSSEGEGGGSASGMAETGPPLRMTLEQAEQVLDEARNEERALIWRPAESRSDKRSASGRRKAW